TAGSQFELDVVRRAAGLPEPELFAALDEAVRSGMIADLPSRRLAYGFTHELVRRALYDRLSALRRAELHLRVGEALEDAGARSGRALADLAHHFAAGSPFGGTERAVEYNVLAARAAAGALADESSELRIGLLGGLARALDFQGQHERAAVVRRSAVAMARELEDDLGLGTVLARSYWSRGTTSIEEILEMLTEARDLGEQLGKTEIRAEAMSWRVPALVALFDLESAAQEVAELLEIADQTAQPFMIHVVHHYAG